MRSAGIRRMSIPAPLALLAALAVAGTTIAAPSWSSPTTVRGSGTNFLGDADFARRNVAIAWDSPDSPSRVGIRTSTNSGSTFGAISWIGGARNPSVEICGDGELHTALERAEPGDWTVAYARGNVAGAMGPATLVAPGSDDQFSPDVACAGGRVAVSFLEETVDGADLYLTHALRTGGPFSSPVFLGFDDEPFFFAGLAIAGTRDRLYAAYQTSDDDLHFTRWSVGPGPAYNLTELGETVIGTGTSSNGASEPVIAAAGDKVAVAWFKCGGLFARVSNNRGATWGPARKLIDHVACDGDFGTSPRHLAIRGDRIVLTYMGFGIPNVSFAGLIRTSNDFASFSDDTIADGHRDHMVGFVRAGGRWRMAGAFETQANRIRFRRQT